MPHLKLYVAPHTCAKVPTIALEEIGVPFETELVRTSINQQNSPEYLKLNPRGKVPLLMVDGEPLSENVAIQHWLNTTYPEANLLPKTTSVFEASRQLGDISFFSATVHPFVTRIAMPMKFIPDAAQSFEIVRPVATEGMKKLLAIVETRLEDGPWWYGEAWSSVDSYLFWVWSRITGVGFPQDDFPRIRAHYDRMLERPAVQRAQAREAEDIATMEAEGVYKPPK